MILDIELNQEEEAIFFAGAALTAHTCSPTEM